MEPITLELLRRKFPATAMGVTGYIPMDYFVQNEPAIRAAMRGRDVRVWYRGPRTQKCWGKPSATLRQNATHAVIYRV